MFLNFYFQSKFYRFGRFKRTVSVISSMQGCQGLQKQPLSIRVSIRKTFAERIAKFFFLCASVLREKTTICAIIRRRHFAQNCPIPLLRNSSFCAIPQLEFCAIPQFRENQTVGVFLRIQFWKHLFWNVFLLVTFT